MSTTNNSFAIEIFYNDVRPVCQCFVRHDSCDGSFQCAGLLRQCVEILREQLLAPLPDGAGPHVSCPEAGAVDCCMLCQFSYCYLLVHWHQLFNIFVPDHYDAVSSIFKLNWQIQVYGNARASVVNHCVVAHAAHKWYFVPVTKHTIANPVLGLISNAVKIFSLLAHYFVLSAMFL